MQPTIPIEEMLERFQRLRVVVLGDLMLDEYIWGKAGRVSPEAPVLVIEVQQENHVPGGAANVAHNVRALNAQVQVLGIVGSDEAGNRLLQDLKALGIGTENILCVPERPTTRKTRVIAHHQQVVRVDREHKQPLSDGQTTQLLQRLGTLLPETDLLILSDYRKGCLVQPLVETAIRLARKHSVTIVANPKPESVKWYARVTLLSLNRAETGNLLRTEIENREQVLSTCRHLPDELGIDNLLVTLGEEGMVLLNRQAAYSIPALRVEVYDTTGAGDTVIASVGLALAAGYDAVTAAHFANLAGGCVVRHVGVAVPTTEELMAMVEKHG